MNRSLFARTICIAVLLVICLSTLPVYGQSDDTPARQPLVPSLDVLILVDESETMWNHTDAAGKRVQAVNLFIDQLSASAQSGARHRVGVIAFGTEPRVIPWTFLDSEDDAERIKQGYQTVHNAIGSSEYTDINKALAKALEIMKAEHDPDRKPALVLISDGQPTRPSPPVNEGRGWDVVYAYLLETQRLVDEFKAVSYSGDFCLADGNTPLYTLAVGTDVLLQTDRSTPEFVELYKRFWQTSANSTKGYYETVTPLDEIGSAVTEVFARLLCGVVHSKRPAIEDLREFEYTVEEEYFQIFFTISGKDNPAIEARVFRPGQEEPIQSGDQGVAWREDVDYEVWSVKRSEPWTGNWRVALEGKGNAYFSYVLFSSFSIEVQQPSHGSALPTGKPIEIRARVIQKVEPEQPAAVAVRDFKVSVTKPDSTEEQLSLEERDGVYAGRFDGTGQEGEYGLTFNATLQDGTKVYEFAKVEILPSPWLECLQPLEGSVYESDEPIPLEAKVHLAGGASPIDVELRAALLKDGEIAEETGLDCAETRESNVLACNGHFQPGHNPGAYVVNVILDAALPPGIPVHDHSMVAITLISPSPTSTPTPTLTPAPPTPTAPETPT
ncbi:MAG: VWA domain-containing protein, partial [Anaerolineae bacterium]|nr:VWA domain-containing protein [Anaerolineae bacterium]